MKTGRRLLGSLRGDLQREDSTLSSILHHQTTFQPNPLCLKEKPANHRGYAFISSDRGSCLTLLDESTACYL